MLSSIFSTVLCSAVFLCFSLHCGNQFVFLPHFDYYFLFLFRFIDFTQMHYHSIYLKKKKETATITFLRNSWLLLAYKTLFCSIVWCIQQSVCLNDQPAKREKVSIHSNRNVVFFSQFNHTLSLPTHQSSEPTEKYYCISCFFFVLSEEYENATIPWIKYFFALIMKFPNQL